MRRRVKGQTLVEVALILPVLVLAVVVFAQIWELCHNSCTMQDRVFRFVQEFREQRAPPPFHLEHRMIQPWRPFPGYATVKTPGYLAAMRGSVVFWKGGWGLPPVRISKSAEIPKEPIVPEEQ